METEYAESGQDREQLELLLGRALEDGLVDDVIVAQSLEHCYPVVGLPRSDRRNPVRNQAVRGVRHWHPNASNGGVRHRDERRTAGPVPRQRHIFFGHLGDGNLHVLSGPHEEPQQLHAVEEMVYAAVARVGGSISAEHGIGVVKRPFLGVSRSLAEFGLMAELKTLFDPLGILNAGRILGAAR